MDQATIQGQSERLLEFLNSNQLEYRKAEHPAVFTCEEAARWVPDELGGARTKNLFLRDRPGKRHFLVAVPPSKSVDLKALAQVIPCSKLSLGSPERLQRCLGVTPGSVTLMALLNDSEHQVELLLDRDLAEADSIRCHPLVNTATLVIEQQTLREFLKLTGHQPSVLDIPERSSG